MSKERFSPYDEMEERIRAIAMLKRLEDEGKNVTPLIREHKEALLHTGRKNDRESQDEDGS